MKLPDARDDVLVQAYINLREVRAQRKSAYELADSQDKQRQAKIEAEFLRRFSDRGIDSISARGVGTAYASTRTSATVADWDALLSFIRENEAWEMLEHRVSKTAVDQFREVNDDLPPGVNWSVARTIGVRT